MHFLFIKLSLAFILASLILHWSVLVFTVCHRNKFVGCVWDVFASSFFPQSRVFLLLCLRRLSCWLVKRCRRGNAPEQIHDKRLARHEGKKERKKEKNKACFGRWYRLKNVGESSGVTNFTLPTISTEVYVHVLTLKIKVAGTIAGTHNLLCPLHHGGGPCNCAYLWHSTCRSDGKVYWRVLKEHNRSLSASPSDKSALHNSRRECTQILKKTAIIGRKCMKECHGSQRRCR